MDENDQSKLLKSNPYFTPFVKDVVDIITSLHISLQNAGGSIEMFSMEKLSKITAEELLYTLASNKIRFIYKK